MKTLTRLQFEQLDQMSRSEFFKNGGKLIETPGKPNPKTQHPDMDNLSKIMTRAAYERIPIEHRGAYVMDGWTVGD